jgi:hypothetical protein
MTLLCWHCTGAIFREIYFFVWLNSDSQVLSKLNIVIHKYNNYVIAVKLISGGITIIVFTGS